MESHTKTNSSALMTELSAFYSKFPPKASSMFPSGGFPPSLSTQHKIPENDFSIPTPAQPALYRLKLQEIFMNFELLKEQP